MPVEKKYLASLKEKLKMDETVIDVQSRLEYSNIKKSARSEDVDALRRSFGLPKTVDFKMDEESKINSIICKLQVK